MALRSFTPNGLTLIRDSELCDGESLAFACVRSAKSLVILTITGRERVLRRKFPSICTSASFVYFDSTTDEEQLSEIVISVIRSSPSACLVDCVDVLVDRFHVDLVVALMFQLKEKVPVLTVCPEASIDEEQFSRFCAVANSIHRLAKRGLRCVSESTIYKANGKATKTAESFTLADDLKIASEKYTPSVATILADGPVQSENAEAELSAKELNAKSSLVLPFTSVAKQAELNTLRLADRKVRVGGQIIYTPDKEDDLDDSDPDDDLNL
ncbi:hypothetical protein Q1695_013308 [Nippostrongylus brasiliensis]|nr:hypothetical protein Q1695_013308 [Nippostrongylus brasiliensis]